VHTLNNNPYYPNYYDPTKTLYYKLNPIMTGIKSVLCNYNQRTFTTDITHLPVGKLHWTNEGYLNFVGGVSNDTLYTVSGAGVGNTEVNLAISTLSGTWNSYPTYDFSFQVNRTPQVTDQKVDGSGYYYAQEICPGGHWLTFVPSGSNATDTWTVPPGIQYTIDQGNHRLGFYFINNPSLTFTVKATNSCGTGDIRSFYLIKKTSGCNGMTLYPNPASDNVTLTMTENIPSTEYGDTTGFISGAITDAESIETITYTIRIFNNQSALLSTFTRSGGSFNIPLVNMKDGAYIIEVSNGKNSYRQQLIIKHN
jgi:hypothetical protein